MRFRRRRSTFRRRGGRGRGGVRRMRSTSVRRRGLRVGFRM